jgi:hypothetical protein
MPRGEFKHHYWPLPTLQISLGTVALFEKIYDGEVYDVKSASLPDNMPILDNNYAGSYLFIFCSKWCIVYFRLKYTSMHMWFNARICERRVNLSDFKHFLSFDKRWVFFYET